MHWEPALFLPCWNTICCGTVDGQGPMGEENSHQTHKCKQLQWVLYYVDSSILAYVYMPKALWVVKALLSCDSG